jgi:hypothetical protein
LKIGTLQWAVVFPAREADCRQEGVAHRSEKNAITRLLPFEKPSNRIFSRQRRDPWMRVGLERPTEGSSRHDDPA